MLTKTRGKFAPVGKVRIHRVPGSHVAYENADGKTLYATYSTLFRQFGVRAAPGTDVLIWIDKLPGVTVTRGENMVELETED